MERLGPTVSTFCHFLLSSSVKVGLFLLSSEFLPAGNTSILTRPKIKNSFANRYITKYHVFVLPESHISIGHIKRYPQPSLSTKLYISPHIRLCKTTLRSQQYDQDNCGMYLEVKCRIAHNLHNHRHRNN